MPKKASNVDIWLTRETSHVRKALENASSYFDSKDDFNVNTLEAIYAQESSFGLLKREHGSKNPAGEFHLGVDTAKRYGLSVAKGNDQRFDIDYASITAARYLKNLNKFFSKGTLLLKGLKTIPIQDIAERRRFVLASYNVGEGTIAKAQRLALQAGKDPMDWNNVKEFLKALDLSAKKVKEIREYVDNVSENEIEFAQKSSADKKAKDWKFTKPKSQGNKCHWITKDGHHILICD